MKRVLLSTKTHNNWLPSYTIQRFGFFVVNCVCGVCFVFFLHSFIRSFVRSLTRSLERHKQLGYMCIYVYRSIALGYREDMNVESVVLFGCRHRILGLRYIRRNKQSARATTYNTLFSSVLSVYVCVRAAYSIHSLLCLYRSTGVYVCVCVCESERVLDVSVYMRAWCVLRVKEHGCIYDPFSCVRVCVWMCTVHMDLVKNWEWKKEIERNNGKKGTAFGYTHTHDALVWNERCWWLAAATTTHLNIKIVAFVYWFRRIILSRYTFVSTFFFRSFFGKIGWKMRVDFCLHLRFVVVSSISVFFFGYTQQTSSAFLWLFLIYKRTNHRLVQHWIAAVAAVFPMFESTIYSTSSWHEI